MIFDKIFIFLFFFLRFKISKYITITNMVGINMQNSAKSCKIHIKADIWDCELKTCFFGKNFTISALLYTYFDIILRICVINVCICWVNIWPTFHKANIGCKLTALRVLNPQVLIKNYRDIGMKSVFLIRFSGGLISSY